jgi:hypothetical protein
MGLNTLLKCPTFADYFELKRLKREAEEKGEVFDEKEWLKNRRRDASVEKVNIRECTSNDSVRCPKCGSTQITANKKGFSVYYEVKIYIVKCIF